jgi:siroheme synthase (precorrin-2 oxidase/ferrochelatase)
LTLFSVKVKAKRVRDDIQKQMQLHQEQYELTVQLQRREKNMDFFESRHAQQRTFEEFCDLDQDVRDMNSKMRKLEERRIELSMS